MNKQKWCINHYFLAVCLLSFPGMGKVYAQPASRDFTEVLNSGLDKDYQYFDLNCNVGYWGGYFAPSRWAHSVAADDEPGLATKKGVSIFADGNDMIVLGNDRTTREEWSIEIPVPGYLSFRLLPADAARREKFEVMINDRAARFNLRSDGLYYSPYLRAGDRFLLRIPAGTSEYQWTKLLFHTNYSAVIVRTAESIPARRYVPITADLIQRVVFPSDEPGSWPVFDRDGDPTTLDDRTELRASTERFAVEYVDEIVPDGAHFYLQRTFTIREKCSRGNWLRTDRRWVKLPIIAE